MQIWRWLGLNENLNSNGGKQVQVIEWAGKLSLNKSWNVGSNDKKNKIDWPMDQYLLLKYKKGVRKERKNE